MKNTTIPDKDKFIKMLTDELDLCGIYISDQSAEKLYTLTSFMLEYNSHTNLTAITEEELIITRHLADSLSIIRHIPENSTVADIGSGAGFPALPVAIVRGDLKITAIESTGKKCAYISEAVQRLGVSNITVLNKRAEEAAFDVNFRESFDISTARAVAELNVISELCLPFVRKNGAFIAMKSQLSLEREISEAKSAIKTLGGKIETTDMFEIPEIGSDETLGRACVIIKKISETSKNYPRKYSQIARKPL